MGYSLQVEMDFEISEPPPFLHWRSKGMLDALAMGYEVNGNYFLSGAFRRELDSRLRIVAWAGKNKIPRLRLIWN